MWRPARTRWWRRALTAGGLAVLVGAVAVPAQAAEPPPEPAATATMLELGVEAPQTNVPFAVIATVQVVPPATGTPQGSIDLTLDGQPRGSAVLGADGTATFTVEVSEPGSHELAAHYSGSDDFAPSDTQSVFAADAPPDPGSNLPVRPALPRAVGRSSEPPPPAPTATPPAAPLATRPSEMAFTGAFTLPGLLVGLSSIGLGLGCRYVARRRPPA
jgi:hypothetical protein